MITYTVKPLKKGHTHWGWVLVDRLSISRRFVCVSKLLYYIIFDLSLVEYRFTYVIIKTMMKVDNLILKLILPTFQLDAPVLLKARCSKISFQDQVVYFENFHHRLCNQNLDVIIIIHLSTISYNVPIVMKMLMVDKT